VGNLKHGLGRKQYANGDVYDGLWSHGKAEGPGRHAAWLQAGTRVQLRPRIASSPSGAPACSPPTLLSDWRWLFVACCRYIWHTGNEYDGEWRAGKMHGQGTLKWRSGTRGRPASALPAACWRRPAAPPLLAPSVFAPHGSPASVPRSGPPTSALLLRRPFSCAGERYDGEWQEGLEDGVGVFTWTDGSSYEGFWRKVGAAAGAPLHPARPARRRC
jgi:1-phosphatidylinositol-4-phosphate 5-kinase